MRLGLGLSITGQLHSAPPSGDPFIDDVLYVNNFDVASSDADLTSKVGSQAATATRTMVIDSTVSFNGKPTLKFDTAARLTFTGTSSSWSVANRSEFCFECWVYLTTVASIHSLWGKRDGASAEEFWNYVDTSSAVQFFTARSGDPLDNASSLSGEVSVDTWHHIAVQRRLVGSDLTLENYLDGVLVGSAVNGGLNPSSNSQNVHFGQDVFNTDRYLRGYSGPIRYTSAARYAGAFTPESSFPYE